MPLLSHYTDRGGLEGMARTKTFWATDFLDLKHNDNKELLFGYVEMSKRGMRSAIEEIAKYLKPEERPSLDYEKVSKGMYAFFRESFEGPRGSEHLYVTSFAKGRDQDEDDRGILSMWREYCRDGGYCLQFDSEDVRKLIEREGSHRHYALIDLARVHYGVDETDEEFSALNYQMMQTFLIQVDEAKKGLGLKPEPESLWPGNTFAFRFLTYCAKHKDPLYKDEREVRILAVPAKENNVQAFDGIKRAKAIKKRSDGRRYIDIGADWSPGIEPRRIIVGPKGAQDIDDVLALYTRRPVVLRPDYPIS